MRSHRSILHRAATVVACTAGTLTACYPYTPGCLLANCDPRTRDARNKLDHLADYLTLERGDETASGAPVLGQSGSLGSGRLSVAVRARTISQRAPVIGDRSVRTDGTSEPTDFPMRQSSAVILGADASFGLLNGFKAGDGRVLGVDVLAGVAALPAYPTPEASPAGSTSLSFSYGARLGVLGETRGLPAVSFTWRRRTVPALSLATGNLEGIDGGTVSLSMTDLGLQVSNRRLTIGKQFGRVGATVGIGEDIYRAKGRLRSTVEKDGVTQNTDRDYVRILSRPHSYVGLSYRFGTVTVAGELGRLGQAGPQAFSPTYHNTVGGYLGGARSYLSLGARLGG